MSAETNTDNTQPTEKPEVTTSDNLIVSHVALHMVGLFIIITTILGMQAKYAEHQEPEFFWYFLLMAGCFAIGWGIHLSVRRIVEGITAQQKNSR